MRGQVTFIDWAVWTATGESVSPTLNRLLRQLGLTYEWWAYNELSPDPEALVSLAPPAAR